MHPFSLEKEKTNQVTGGTFTLGSKVEPVLNPNPVKPVFPPKDWATTLAVGEEGGYPPIDTTS
ncbi:hypothetical protein [Pseudoalteromonas sp. '520P1 No. 423']|uniref:hypothetical protein n=1 Tax=Pseudoalteromonas sp. '520P1 No. 423' TaxID=1690037 RepID=UPI0007516A53|nr:hypothetical protein [Pseudoalteromonas sp. '520P1 No. 423']